MKAGSTPWYHSGQGLGRDSGILLENLFSPGLLLHSRGKTRMNTPRKAGLRKGTPEGGSFRCCIFFSGVCPPNTSLHSGSGPYQDQEQQTRYWVVMEETNNCQ
ncbi:uncharacterized protein LOC144321967 isoform X3 [Canis aureus]